MRTRSITTALLLAITLAAGCIVDDELIATSTELEEEGEDGAPAFGGDNAGVIGANPGLAVRPSCPSTTRSAWPTAAGCR